MPDELKLIVSGLRTWAKEQVASSILGVSKTAQRVEKVTSFSQALE
jgi:hypothetical protein